MTKRTSVKAWFEARCRSDEDRGVPFIAHRPKMQAWPLWARRAYTSGRLMQSANLDKQQFRARRHQVEIAAMFMTQ